MLQKAYRFGSVFFALAILAKRPAVCFFNV